MLLSKRPDQMHHVLVHAWSKILLMYGGREFERGRALAMDE
jgi:hypothetical protein